MQPHLRSLATLLTTALLSGCCGITQTLSAVFCGPREDPWVSKDFSSSRAALDTFLGAVARDDVETIYLTLGHAFKRSAGLGELEFRAAWQRIKTATPGIHLADQAMVSAAEQTPGGTSYTLTLNTTPAAVIRISLVQQNFWSVTVRPDGSSEDQTTGEVIPKLEKYFKVLPHGERSPVRIELPGPEFPKLETSEFQRMELGREWKLSKLRIVRPQG